MALSLTGTAHLEMTSGVPSYSGDYTTVFWFFNDEAATNRYIWSIWNSTTTSEDELRLSSTQALRIYSYDGGFTEIGGSTTHATLPAGWNQIAIRRIGLDMGVSLNGGAFVEFSNPEALIRISADRFSIGSDRVGNTGPGLFWNLVHWNRGLTNTEIGDFYTEDYGSVADTDLYDYWPLTSDALAAENGNDFTEVNSPTYVSDPSGQSAWPGSVATPSGTATATGPTMSVTASGSPLGVSGTGVASGPTMSAVGVGVVEALDLHPFTGEEVDGVSSLTPVITSAVASRDWPLIAQLSAAASTAVGMSNPYDQAHFQWDFGNRNRPSAGSKIGVNLAPVTYHNDSWCFVDIMKMSRPWTLGSGSAGSFTVDDYGHLVSIDASTNVVTYIFQGISDYPGGVYTCYFDGEGTREWSGDVTAVLTTSTGKETINVVPSGGITLKITATNPANPIRNIKLIMPGFEKAGRYRNNPFHPTFLSRLRGYSRLRMMDWGKTNESAVVSWSDRTTLLHATQDQDNGVSLELQIELANAAQIEPWFCIPHQANDDYVTQAATLIQSLLDPSLNFHLEYTNEGWNFGFSQAGYLRDQGALLGLGATTTQNNRRYYSRRSVEIFDIFETVFGGTSRFNRIMGDQRGGTTTLRYVLDFENAYLKTDEVAVNCYFGNNSGTPPTLGGVTEATIEADWDVNTMLDWCETSLAETITAIDTSYGVSHGEYGIPLSAYEGGQHLTGFTSSTVQALMTAANRHSRMKTIYTSMLESWASSTSDGVFCAYNDCMGFSTSGRWGSLETQTQSRASAPKYDALQSYIENQAEVFPLTFHPVHGFVCWSDSDQDGPLATHAYRNPGTYTAQLIMAAQSTSQVVQTAAVTAEFTVTDAFAKMYFDSVNGNDANDGSLGNPKQSWSALKTWLEDATEDRRALLAGDSQWTPTSNITITATGRRIVRYGAGANPRILSDGNGSIRQLNTSSSGVNDFVMSGVDIDANDLEVNAFASSGGSPLTENNPREGIHLLDCNLSNSTSSCVQIVSNGAQHVSLINCVIDHGNGDSQGFSARLHEFAMSAPREFLSVVGATFLGGNGGTNGDNLDHHIYPSGWHKGGLFRWISFNPPEGTQAFCINLNCQQEGPGIDNADMLVAGCDLTGTKHGIDHGCGTFVSETEGTLLNNVIQDCAFHDFKDPAGSSCLFGRNIERLVLRDSLFYSLQDGIAYQLNCADLDVRAYRNKGHSAFGGTTDRFFRMRYAGQTWTMYDNHWFLTTGSSNRILEFDEALLGTYSLADKYWAPSQANPFEGLSANRSMASWLGEFTDCSQEEPEWFDPEVGDFSIPENSGPPTGTGTATGPRMTATGTAHVPSRAVGVASGPTMSAVGVANAIGTTSAVGSASGPRMSVTGAGSPGFSGVELDVLGPLTDDWRSTKFIASVEGIPIYVYAATREAIINAVGWDNGDLVELSCIDYGAEGTTTVVISLADFTPITSARIIPGDKGVVQEIVDGDLYLTMPPDVRVHVEVNGDRGETIDVFSSPMKTVPALLVDFNTLTKSVASVEGTGILTVPGHGITTSARVLFRSTDTLPTVLLGTIVDHHPVIATRIDDNTLQLTDPVTLVDYEFGDEGLGELTITVCEWTDTVNTLYFGRGVHYAGLQFAVSSNCDVYLDEGAVVIGTWKYVGNAAGGVRFHGPGKMNGDVIPRPVFQAIPDGIDGPWFEYCLFYGTFDPLGTDNVVQDVTCLSFPYYLSLNVVAHWERVKIIAPWWWSCDGVRNSYRLTTGLPLGASKCFMFVGDDGVNFNGPDRLYEDCTVITTNNSCFNGGYWPSNIAESNTRVVDCDAMHLAADVGGRLGADSIVKSLIDGFESQSALMHSGVTFENFKVWGPVACEPIILGNTIYPFYDTAFNNGGDRDQHGQLFNWLFDDIWFEETPAKRSVIIGLDEDNTPHDITFSDVVIGGVAVTPANYETFFDVSPLSYNINFGAVLPIGVGEATGPRMTAVGVASPDTDPDLQVHTVGPNTEELRSQRFDLTVNDIEAYVYGFTRQPVMRTVAWEIGDFVEQSWCNFGAVGRTTVSLGLVGGDPVEAFAIYPDDLGARGEIVSGRLVIDCPTNVQLRIEINYDRANVLHLFANPPKEETQSRRVDFSSLVKTITSVELATGRVTAPMHGYSIPFRAVLSSSDTLPVASTGTLTRSEAIIAIPLTGDVMQLLDPDLLVPYVFSSAGTGTLKIARCEWNTYAEADTDLYFGAGIHEIGRGLPIGPGTSIYADEGAVLRGTFNVTDGLDAVLRGPGLILGDYVDPIYVEDLIEEELQYKYSVFEGTSTGFPIGPASIRGLTLVAQPFYATQRAIHSFRNVKMISPWNWRTDGFRPLPKSTSDLDTEVIDCYGFIGDDGCRIWNERHHVTVSNTFITVTNNSCYNGIVKPIYDNRQFLLNLNGCYAMHLGYGDNQAVGGTGPVGSKTVIKTIMDGSLITSQNGHFNGHINGLRVLGPLASRIFVFGNMANPFGYESEYLDMAGQFAHWTISGLICDETPGQKSILASRDPDNAPNNIVFTNFVVGGVQVVEGNHEEFVDVGEDCFSIYWDTEAVPEFIVEDGSGLSNSNSFCSREFATEYLINYGNPGEWSDANDSDQEAALRLMTRWLSISKTWKGYKSIDGQAQAHPRIGLVNEDGYPVDHRTVHADIKRATAYGAWRILKGDWEPFPDQEAVSNQSSNSVTIGPISISSSSAGPYRSSSEVVLPVVLNLIKKFLVSSGPLKFLRRG